MAKVLIGNIKGPQGDAATISVGTVSTGAAGSNAAVTNSGTSGAAVLNFTIPQGAKGDDGTPGVTDYATSAAAGLVRIGTDFNIDSSTGTISENNTFSQASTLAEINSGDSHATILGKIKKFMNTLMPSTFVKDNLTSTDTDKALYAKQGKLLAAEDALLEGDLATVQSSSTASRAFTKGEYLVLEGQLYKVTTNIANGGTITPGTNVSSCSAGGELTSLNDSFVNATTPTQITVTAGTGVTINSQRIYKIGRIAICEFDITTSSSLATNSNILTGCPAAIATWEFFGEKTSDGSTHTFYATSGGYIRNSGSLPAGTWIADAMYVTYS